MYVQGVSTRTVKAVTEALCGHTVSARTVSRNKKSLEGLLRRVAQRRLEKAFPRPTISLDSLLREGE